MSTPNSQLPTPKPSGRRLRAAIGIVGLASIASLAAASGQDRIESAPRPGPVAPRPGVPSTGPRDGPPGGVEGEATGTARITGRVVRGDNGAPLRGVVVRVVGERAEEPRSATTDADGRYEIDELPAGRFFVSAMKGGYVSIVHGQRRPNEQGRPIELDGRQHLPNVNFSLPRGSVVAGRITDEFGEPVAHLGVSAMQYRYFGGRRQLFPAGRDATDDRGQYRIFGLPPGDYYVSASSDGPGIGMMGSASANAAPTYYPGTPAVHEAERVRLGIGEENTSVSFAVLPARTVTISGIVLESSGARARSGFIMVQPDGRGAPMFTMRGGGMVRPDGTFRLGNVSPGEYILHVNLGDGPRDESESARVPISVSSEDVSGLTIVTSPGTRVAGQLVFETAPPDSIRPSDFMFVVRSEVPFMGPGAGPFTPEDDWSFETTARDSSVFIQSVRAPDGWVLKAVLHGGVDVIDTGLEIRSGQGLEGLQLVVSNRFSTVTGAVATAGGRPAADYTVVVFADDPNRWTPVMTRYIATARPNQRGTFEIRRLPPARYLAAAVDYLEEGQHTDPEYLETLRAYATPFELGDGERRTLKLELVHLD